MKNKAWLVIDVLNDFCKEKGSLVVPGAEKVLPLFQRKLEEARQAGHLIIYICDSHRPDDPEFALWPPHAIAGEWGAQVVEELAPQPRDFIVKKRRYSAFFGTELDLLLRELEVGTLALTGLVTNICVMGTAQDAAERGYKIEVVQDLVIGLDPEMHQFALKQMKEVFGASLV